MATFVLVAVFQKIFGLKIILTQHSFKLKIDIDMAEWSHSCCFWIYVFRQ